jgi:hypothetical protein
MRRLERVVQIVVRNLPPKIYARFRRATIMQTGPQPRIDDFCSQLRRGLEMARRVEWPGRIQTVNVDVEYVPAHQTYDSRQSAGKCCSVRT